MREIQIGSDGQADPLYRLQLLFLRAERQGDLRLAARILERAARERPALPGAGEGVANPDLPELTPEQAREEIARYLESFPSRPATEPSFPDTAPDRH